MPDENEKDTPEKERKAYQSGLKYLHIAFVLPTAVIAGWLLGAWLDGRFGTKWIYLLGLFLGVVAGFYDLIRSIIQMSKET